MFCSGTCRILGKKNKLHPEKKGCGESNRCCCFRSLAQNFGEGILQVHYCLAVRIFSELSHLSKILKQFLAQGLKELFRCL